MKKFLLITLIPIVSSGPSLAPLEKIEVETEIVSLKPKKVEPIITEEDLIMALIQVESRGNDSAVGDRHIKGGEAVGALQIRPVMVREVNRILKLKKSDKRFKLSDRYDRDKTLEMFYIWKNYHHNDSDFETIARNWNGGPRGYKRNSTIRYWKKVEKQLDNYLATQE